MPKPKSFLRLFTETGPLVALTVASALLIGIAGPASAQLFNFGFGGPSPPQRQAPRNHGGGGWFGNDFFAPFQQQPSQQQQQQQSQGSRQQDFSRAPPPAKRETAAERNVLVLGDAMADWLAYGLEDAYSEQPDMGVIRKHRTASGLIKYQPKGDPADWTAAAKGIVAAEKADAIVVMLGLNDRMSIREPVVEKKEEKKDEKKDDKKVEKKDDKKPEKDARSKPADTKPGAAAEDAAKRDDKTVDAELSPDDDSDTPPTARDKTARAGSGLYEFRDDRWVELYSKKIDELIAVLKTRGVPVLWVGLPAIRGQKATSDMLFLDSLYREASAKAGITYVDVWDGFVDEGGRFLQKGPDFEGQIRQLRTSDGVFFTKPGARKLAHYVEREVTRLLAGRSAPIALPSEPATPDTSAEPGKPSPRPLAGPILPLVASSVGTDQLLGGGGSRPAAVDALAARTMVKGEALAPPAGRADDFAWPRREIGREQARGESPVASTTPDGTAAPATPAPAAPPKPAAQKRVSHPANPAPATAPPAAPLRDFFGFGNSPQQPVAPRPPRSIGPSAAGFGAPWR